MSLDWNISKVKDNETVCWRPTKDGKFQLFYVTEAIIWRSMAVDIGNIKDEATAEEFVYRSYVFDELFGHKPLVEGGKERSFTLEEIRQHIGLTTNVFTTTRAKWWARMLKEVQHDHDYKADRWIKEQQKATSAV